MRTSVRLVSYNDAHVCFWHLKVSVTLKAIVKIQASYRRYQEGAKFRKQRKCTIRIQSWHRAAVARKALYAMMRGIVTLQALFRRKSEQKHIEYLSALS